MCACLLVQLGVVLTDGASSSVVSFDSFLQGRAQLLEGTRASVPALSGRGITTAAAAGSAGRSRGKKGRSRSGKKISRSRSGSKLSSSSSGSVGAGTSGISGISGTSGTSDKKRRRTANPAGRGAVRGAQTRAPSVGSGARGQQLRVSRKRKAEADASSLLAVDEVI